MSFANSAALELLKLEREASKCIALLELFPSLNLRRAKLSLARGKEYIEKVFHNGSGSLQARLLSLAGTTYGVWLRRAPRDADAEGSDERRRVPDQYLFALESAGLGAWHVDLRNHRMTWSDRTRTLMGVSVNETVRPDLFFERLHPDDRERTRRALFQALREENGYYDCEYRVIWPDGSIHWLHGWGRPYLGSDGRPDYLEGVVADIDKRNAAAERSEADRSALRAVLECAPTALIAIDENGCVTIWNPAAERVLGFSNHAVFGKPVPFSIDLSAEPRCREQRVLRADGSEIDIVCSVAPFGELGAGLRPSGYVIVVSDTTERNRLHRRIEQDQRLESLGVLAGGVAHDFNNLLTGILGNASLGLYSLDEASDVRPLLEDILSAGQRAAALTRQLLAYAGKTRVVASRIELSGVVNETTSLARASLQNEQVKLVVTEEPGVPPVEADSNQLQQVLLSLIMNGAEAIGDSAKGSVHIHLRKETLSPSVIQVMENGEVLPGGHYAVLDVRDTGVGMDERTRTRIFEPFFSTKFTGRGLGLSAVLGIVRQHRGALRVQTKPGAGSTFSVYLPVADRSPSAPLADKTPADSLEGAGLIMVVDDEETVRNTVRRSLERWNYRVLLAENGQAAAEALPEIAHKLSAIVLDLTMPVMGGEEALEHLRRIRPDIPVILTSGYSEPQAMRRMKGKGVSAFLQKPFSGDQLARKLRDLLKKRVQLR